MKIYGFVYFRWVDFPQSNFEFKFITQKNFFKGVTKILNFKSHLDHSHVTGKIRGYVNIFCNLKLRQSQLELSCLGHSMFGYNFYFILKCIRLSTWGMKKLSIGGNNLMNINFGKKSDKLKFFDTQKIFYTSL